MNIAVVGTGYVGLVTGTCLADTGNHVICVDIDEAKVASHEEWKGAHLRAQLGHLVRPQHCR